MKVIERCRCGATIRLDHSGRAADLEIGKALTKWRTEHNCTLPPGTEPGDTQ